MFTNKKRAGIDTFVCAVSLYVAETPNTSINQLTITSITHNAFWHCRVRFSWTTFLETAVTTGECSRS